MPEKNLSTSELTPIFRTFRWCSRQVVVIKILVFANYLHKWASLHMYLSHLPALGCIDTDSVPQRGCFCHQWHFHLFSFFISPNPFPITPPWNISIIRLNRIEVFEFLNKSVI